MKKLLLSVLFLSAGFASYAQGSCAAAVNITANGTFTSGAINGTFASGCYTNTTNDAGSPMKARWWKYTPTTNGEITVTSAIPANPGGTTGTDSRLSILKGTCAALTCVDANDDVSDTDYRSSLTVPVAAGTTYYIEWDNNWQATTFSFQFTFVAADCIRPARNEFYRPGGYSTTGASVAWYNAIGNPASYDVDWSINFSDAAGTGTIVNFPAGTTGTPVSTVAALTGLPESQNFRYYVRSNCGASQSAWQGPNYGYLAVPLPYSNDFENADNNYTDGFVGFSLINTNATATPPFYGDGDTGRFMFTGNSTTAVSDRWAYSRGISLVAGEQVTVNFKTRAYVTTDGDVPSDMTLDVTVGNAQSASSQTQVLTTITENSLDAYTERSATFTAIEDGIYHFGFHNNSPVGTTATFLFFDTLDISSTLGVSSFDANNVSIYPNPAKNSISVSNSLNATVESIEMTDLNGRVVKSQKVNATEAQVSISDLSVGVYMMKIKTDKGIATKKVIKE